MNVSQREEEEERGPLTMMIVSRSSNNNSGGSSNGSSTEEEEDELLRKLVENEGMTFAKSTTVSPAATFHPLQREVEVVCCDLLKKFRFAARDHPKRTVQSVMTSHNGDPLDATIRLLVDSLDRIKFFLFSLDPMKWLTASDRIALYNSHVCAVSILRASVGFNLSSAPPAYPLPYGEYLGEIEALHLILAHDLYNELRSLLAHIQELEIRELHIMLLVMMVAFFTPPASAVLPPNSKAGLHIQQPDKVVKVHDYYTHKLQTYLNLRHGPELCAGIMNSILTVIEKVRNFSGRLREFLVDVTRCGLQKQYESVCENIGLMAFLLQTEPDHF